MSPVFREREKEIRTMLPAITRMIHNPIESLGRVAEHMRTAPEATYRNISDADFACRVCANVAPLGLEGSPLPRRFERLLEAL